MTGTPPPSTLGRVLLLAVGVAAIVAGLWLVSVARARRNSQDESVAQEQEQGAAERTERPRRHGPAYARFERPEDEEGSRTDERAGEGAGAGTSVPRSEVDSDGAVRDQNPSTPSADGPNGATAAGGTLPAGLLPGTAGESAGTNAGSASDASANPSTTGPGVGGMPGMLTGPGGAIAAAAMAAGSGDPYQGRTGALPADTTRAPTGPVITRSLGGAPFLVTSLPPGKIQAGQDVVIGASLVDGSGSLVTPTAMEIIVSSIADVQPETYVPMLPGDATSASQFVYHTVAPMDVPAAGAGPMLMHFFVRATGQIDGPPFDRGAAGTFAVNNPGARIDPASARVARVAGDIVLAVQVQVQRTGRYFASAELWGGADATRPVAFAHERLDGPPPGAQPLNLLFGGAIIHASNIDGPYVVRNVQFIQIDSNPPHEQDPIAQLPPTPPWRHGDF